MRSFTAARRLLEAAEPSARRVTMLPLLTFFLFASSGVSGIQLHYGFRRVIGQVPRRNAIVLCSGNDGVERRGSDALELFLYFFLQVWLVAATSLHHVGVLLLNTYMVTVPTLLLYFYIFGRRYDGRGRPTVS